MTTLLSICTKEEQCEVVFFWLKLYFSGTQNSLYWNTINRIEKQQTIVFWLKLYFSGTQRGLFWNTKIEWNKSKQYFWGAEVVLFWESKGHSLEHYQ